MTLSPHARAVMIERWLELSGIGGKAIWST
jgi:hypothetical protein